MLRQITLGDSGKKVTAIGLGAMPLSLDNRPDEKTALQVIKAFIDGGGNFIDTANVYCIDDSDVGHNEQLIHKALTQLGKQNEIIVATKGGLRRPKGSWDVDASPEWLRASCEKSIRDLKTDCIFLYQLHAPDSNVPITESVGELARLQAEGKIRYIGLSNVNTHEIMQALAVTPIMSVQNRCNILERKSFTNGVIGLCEKENIVFIPHSPVGGHSSHSRLIKSSYLRQMSDKYGVTEYQIALAWLLHQGAHILPIPGASKVSSITSSLQAMAVHLGEPDIRILDKIGR
jgi:aryl-alcohol dehydrogenase-like predicted oxidoreductase